MDYIKIEGLRVSYAGKRSKEALRGLDLTVKKGEIFGFLGPNGAGKTTTIKTILGLIPEYEGSLLVFGAAPTDLAVKGRIGYMPEIANYYWYLTPRELLRMYGRIFGIDRHHVRPEGTVVLYNVSGNSDDDPVDSRNLFQYTDTRLYRIGLGRDDVLMGGDQQVTVECIDKDGMDRFFRI